jgi:AAA domain
MFPDRFVMLREHFRCVEPVIRFSMQFYNQELVPLRVPKASERLDPPLIDILVEGGERRGKSKVNPREAEVIVDEIAEIVANPGKAIIAGDGQPRSIGVISLIGAEQALYIQKLLMERIGEAAMVRHRIVCGDSAMLQGDERDIVFLSMVADARRKQSQTAMQYQQRFNVALSRARDRMVLVRSVRAEDLNPNDLKAKVIQHFAQPMLDTINPSADSTIELERPLQSSPCSYLPNRCARSGKSQDSRQAPARAHGERYGVCVARRAAGLRKIDLLQTGFLPTPQAVVIRWRSRPR